MDTKPTVIDVVEDAEEIWDYSILSSEQLDDEIRLVEYLGDANMIRTAMGTRFNSLCRLFRSSDIHEMHCFVMVD
jgi:hypothetical protein